ncbi:hypothetical protein H072_5731 [Dactylellina haptotyla CBS 200.50]|uniref:Uncharacterized protein n=1 Tax=Dactylellina haptotyla (strain CBS 200.50) TaxID=1284197 RepID=S8BLW7_DACHA|nr:hypothetical protein H072_5731 [Dactylellina haptotyla CBS 200.50]
MNSFKSIAKGGWHPEKNKSSSSSHSSSSGGGERFKNFKGLQQVASWTGHGSKGGPDQDRENVTARPLTALKDPYSFGAPPKRDPKAPLPPPSQRSVLGGENQSSPVPEQTPPEAQEEETPQPRGFQINTTGLSTRGLPAPPKRTIGSTSVPSSPSASRPTPPLPSRTQPPPLPGRHTSSSTSSQETSNSFANVNSHGIAPSTAAASTRLAQAGITVPGLNIGSQSPALPSRSKPMPPPPRGPSQDDTSPPPPAYSISELSNRFSSKRPSSSPSTKETGAANPPEGTTWAQKQTALKTTAQFRKEPASVSMSEAASAAQTANNLRQRHGDQLVQGYQRAQAMGIVDQVSGSSPAEAKPQRIPSQAKWGDLASRATKNASEYSNSSSIASEAVTGTPSLGPIAAKKKPPPPPKPKDLETSSPPPPPIPLASKPR